MRSLIIIALVLVPVLLFVWRFSIARPEVPPLSIAPDDPLMKDAVLKAKASITRFRELAAQPNKGIRIKIPFISSSGTTEHLWAEVLSFRGSQMEVRYLTPPVTHTGRLERLHSHSVTDLSDWQVELPSGRYAGGYTMCVMFMRGREQWGSLPPNLEAEEKRYEERLGHNTANRDIAASRENETWIINEGDAVIQKKAKSGLDSLSPWERLVYCLWVADYGMRNAGDLDTSKDVYENFQTEGCQMAESLFLRLTKAAFSLSQSTLEREYFERFIPMCEEIRNAKPDSLPKASSPS